MRSGVTAPAPTHAHGRRGTAEAPPAPRGSSGAQMEHAQCVYNDCVLSLVCCTHTAVACIHQDRATLAELLKKMSKICCVSKRFQRRSTCSGAQATEVKQQIGSVYVSQQQSFLFLTKTNVEFAYFCQCSLGQWGARCQRSCNCAGGAPCSLASGDCGAAGCAAGFTGNGNCATGQKHPTPVCCLKQ